MSALPPGFQLMPPAPPAGGFPVGPVQPDNVGFVSLGDQQYRPTRNGTWEAMGQGLVRDPALSARLDGMAREQTPQPPGAAPPSGGLPPGFEVLPATPPRERMGAGEAGTVGFMRGATMGGLDELHGAATAGGVRAPRSNEESLMEGLAAGMGGADPGAVRMMAGAGRAIGGDPAAQQQYEAGLAAARETQARARADQPLASGIGEVAGGLTTAFVLPAGAVAQTGRQAAVQGARFGAGYGALQGFLEGEGGGENRAVGAGTGAATGAVVGGTVSGATHRLLRGAPAAAPVAPSAEVAEREAVRLAAQEAGVELPRVATMGPLAQKIGGHIASIPLIGAPLVKATARATAQADEAAQALAARLGNGDRAGAAQGAREGVEAYLTGPSNARSFGPPAPGAPTNLASRIDELYRPINEAVGDAGAIFAPERTALALAQLQRRLAESSGSLTGEAARIAQAARQGRLTYQGMQDLRSALGREMDDPLTRGASGGHDAFVQESLYGALTRDMSSALRSIDPELTRTFHQANQATAALRTEAQGLRRILGTGAEASDEQIFARVATMANEVGGNAARLNQLRGVLTPESWGNLQAGVIDRLGRRTAEDVAAPGLSEFSAAQFASNFERMSAEGRRAMFGSDPALLGEVGRLASIMRPVGAAERLGGNTSRTASTGIVSSVVGGSALLAAAAAPVTTITSMLVSSLGARWLASAPNVRAVNQLAQAYSGFVRAPSEATARAVERTANALGVTISRTMGLPQAANDVVAPAVRRAVAEGLGQQNQANNPNRRNDEQGR